MLCNTVDGARKGVSGSELKKVAKCFPNFPSFGPKAVPIGGSPIRYLPSLCLLVEFGDLHLRVLTSLEPIRRVSVSTQIRLGSILDVGDHSVELTL